MEKDLKNLLASFEKAKEWEWSDLIQWVNKLKVLVDAFQGDSFPEKISLEKRLWQCLNPSLPQGLHSITLKIYESILSKPWLEPLEFALFLTGILPFFQYASAENRIQVLSILSNCYKDRMHELELSLPGVVMALLPGMDQDSSYEVNAKVVEFLDFFALNKWKREVFLCVWQCLLTAPRVRFGALSYLSQRISSTDETVIDEFFPNRQLVVNSLISTLNDPEVPVRRSAMELIKSHFPITITEELINTREKILLIESVLKLFLQNDVHIIRRIREWIFQGDSMEKEEEMEYICELLIEALKNIFNSEHKDPTSPIAILQQLISEDRLARSLMKELVVPLLVYAEKFKDNPQSKVCDRCIVLLRSENCMANEGLIWEALTYFFEENMYGNLVQAIKVIKCYIKQFGSFASNLRNIQPLFETILQSMHGLGKEQLSAAMELADTLVNRFADEEDCDLSKAVLAYHAFFTGSCRDEEGISIAEFRVAAQLAVVLEKFVKHSPDYEWLDCLNIENSGAVSVKQMEEADENAFQMDELKIVQIQCLVELMSSGTEAVVEWIKNNMDMGKVISQLWDILDSEQFYLQAVDLIIDFESIDHDTFISVIDSKINYIQDDNISNYLKNINNFILFWKTASAKSLEKFQTIFQKGDAVRTLIKHLGHNLPEISHKAGQWLIEVLQELDCILRPIFLDLVKSVGRFHKQKYIYIILQGLTDLQQIVQYGGDMVIKKASEIIVPPRISKKFDHISREKMVTFKLNTEPQQESYLQLMVKISLLVLLSNEESEGDTPQCNPSREILKVKVSACEFLLMILRQKYAPLACIAMESILKCLSRSLLLNDLVYEVLQLKLLNILNIIIFDCDISTNAHECKALVESSVFSEIFFKGIAKKENFIKIQWINFITKCFPLILKMLRPDRLVVFIEELLQRFCEELQHSLIKEPLIQGLRAVLEMTLDNPISKDIDMMREHFNNVLRYLIDCCKPVKTSLDINICGTRYSGHGEVRDSRNKEIVELLKRISMKDQEGVIDALYKNWLRISLDKNPTHETDEKLVKVTSLIISLDFDAYSLFKGFKFSAILLHLIKPIDQQGACRLAHFAYTVVCFIPISKFTNEINFWDEFIAFCKEIEKTNVPVITVWINEIISLLLRRLQNEKINKSSLPSLNEYVQKTIKTLAKLCLLDDESILSHPYPPSLYGSELAYPISSAAIQSLNTIFYKKESSLMNKEFQDKLISQFQSSTTMLLQAFTSKILGINENDTNQIKIQLMLELLTSLINSGNVFFVKPHRKEIMDFFTSPAFFLSLKNSPGSFQSWSEIIRCISNACYGDRYSLITELFDRMYTGIFSKSTNNELRLASLKCICFAVYSGQVDDYQSCTQLICERLIEFIKIEDPRIKKWVHQCTVVQLLKLSSDSLNDFWPRLWPHLFMDIWQTLTEKQINRDRDSESGDEDNYLLNVFHFVDILTTLMNQDFQLYRWVFFYESVEAYNKFKKNFDDTKNPFTPLYGKLSGARYVGIKEEFEFDEKIYKENKRPLMIENVDPEDFKHLLRKMMRDVLTYSQLITTPDMDAIRRKIEEGFSN